MANFENIRPYSEFAHEAALHGGVDSYLDTIANVNQQIGIAKERGTEGWKGLLLLAGGIVVWEGCKKVYREVKGRYQKRRDKLAVLQNQSDEAKAAIKRCIFQLNPANPIVEEG